MNRMPPQYAGKPVILVHYSLEIGPPQLTLCSGAPFHLSRDGTHPDVPRVACPMCLHIVMQGVNGS